jgi:hypothetical protein
MAIVAVWMSSGIANAALTGYTADWSDNAVIYSTNFDTGEQTALGPSGIWNVRGLALSPVDGSLYAAGSAGLYKVDTTSGIGSYIGPFVEPPPWPDPGPGPIPWPAPWPYPDYVVVSDLTFAPDGTLYGSILSASDPTWHFGIIDTDTGNYTTFEDLTPYTSIASVAIDSIGRCIAWDSETDWLIEIDLTDYSITSIGHLPRPKPPARGSGPDYYALDYGPDDVLYAWDSYRLYSIDIEDVTATRLREFPTSGYAFTVVPEPITLLLLGLGFGIMVKNVGWKKNTKK